MQSSRHVQAFTLVELIVVISIISLLVAMLLPALKNARIAAQITVATSQARQLHLGLSMYANDSKYRLPFANMNPADSMNPSSTQRLWPELLRWGNYVTTDAAFYSPGHDRNVAYYNDLKFSGFGANHLGPMPTHNMHKGGKYGLPLRLSVTDGPSPSTIMLLADSSWSSLFTSNLADGAFILSQGLFTYNGKVAKAYLDGHATAGKAADIYWTAYDQRNGTFNRPANPFWGEPWWDQKYWWLPYGHGPGPWVGR